MLDREEYFKEKYIAFVDVLGFSAIVSQITNAKMYNPQFHLTENDKFHVVEQYYHKCLIELFYEKDSPLEITSISDCFIVSCINYEPLLKFLYYLQSNMIFNDSANVKIVMRGYLTKGYFIHHQQQNLIFGEAYQRALYGEKKTFYPRIEIDKNILKDIKPIYYMILQNDENNSIVFIDYLKRKKFEDMHERTSIEKFIKNKIEEFKNNEEIKKKYVWLQNYNNNVNNYKPSEDDLKKYYFLFPQKERDI